MNSVYKFLWFNFLEKRWCMYKKFYSLFSIYFLKRNQPLGGCAMINSTPCILATREVDSLVCEDGTRVRWTRFATALYVFILHIYKCIQLYRSLHRKIWFFPLSFLGEFFFFDFASLCCSTRPEINAAKRRLDRIDTSLRLHPTFARFLDATETIRDRSIEIR